VYNRILLVSMNHMTVCITNREQAPAPLAPTTLRVGHSLPTLLPVGSAYFAHLKSGRYRISACGTLTGTTAFEAVAFVHSAISPCRIFFNEQNKTVLGE